MRSSKFESLTAISKFRGSECFRWVQCNAHGSGVFGNISRIVNHLFSSRFVASLLLKSYVLKVYSIKVLTYEYGRTVQQKLLNPCKKKKRPLYLMSKRKQLTCTWYEATWPVEHKQANRENILAMAWTTWRGPWESRMPIYIYIYQSCGHANMSAKTW